MAGLSQDNLFRDVFNEGVITGLAERIRAVWPRFAYDEFIAAATVGLAELSFLARSNRIRDALHATLPADFPRAVAILVEALGPELADPGTTVWEAFIVMPQCAYVSTYGRAYYDVAMSALYEMTRRFSAERDLRVFIELDFERTIGILADWTRDLSPHVRRLVSEGIRPRLPMAGRIRRFQDDPRPVLRLLDLLYDDDVLYVRRSVANCINDVSKDHPELAVKTLARWQRGADDRVRWVVRHGARTLLRQGYAGALALFGFGAEPLVEVADPAITPNPVAVGAAAEVSFRLASKAREEQRLMVDLVVHYVKANGRRRDKVFKVRQLELTPAAAAAEVRKRLSFADTAGRRHYPGTHELELQINGRRYGPWPFELTAAGGEDRP